MKKGFIIFAAFVFAACNNQKKPADNSEAANPVVNGTNAPGDGYDEGKELISKNDCSSCHMPNTMLTGPAFITIAKRYPNSNGVAENLARSIINGSKGVFDTTRAMPPHPTINFNDAVKMAQYILHLNSQARQDSLNTIR